MLRSRHALLLLVFLLVPLGAQSFQDHVATFERSFYTKDLTQKIALQGQAIMSLPKDDPRYVDLMYSVIDRAETWYDIGCACEYLTHLQGEMRSRLAKDLFDEKARHSARVRQTIAFMLFDYGRYFRKLEDAEHEAALRGLRDQDARVRKYCALALQVRPEQQAVDALLEAWKDEKDESVITAIVQTLRQLTGKDTLARDLDEWESWRQGTPEPELQQGFRDEEFEVGTYGELELQFDVSGTGSGRPLMVIPPQGFTNRLYRPGLSVLEGLLRTIYIRLPAVGPDLEIPTDEQGHELYPVEMLVEALEELRAELKEDEVILLGCQESSWIVLRYAQLHPEHVAGIILVSGWLEHEDFAASLDLLRLDGTPEEQLYVQVASGNTSLAKLGQSEQVSVSVGKLAALQAQPNDVDTCYLWAESKIFDLRAQGRVLIVPPAPLDRKERIEVPSLFVHGKDDRWSAIKYTSYKGRKYLKPRPRVAEIRDSGPLPWIDNPGEFREQVEKFLERLK
jgi:pimeloyl-ACP methyl ester carboxylesterase